MNNLNITQNSNDLNESEKTQEKLYSNEASLDDILTYSDDISQNVSTNKPNSNSKIVLKKESTNPDITVKLEPFACKRQIPIINSFNSEVAMSFLNNPEDTPNNNINNIINNNNNNLNNKQSYYSKSESKSKSRSLSNSDKKENQTFKSCSNFKSICSKGTDIFEYNNLKDVSEIHLSMSNLL